MYGHCLIYTGNFNISNESVPQYKIYLPISQKLVLYSIDSRPWLVAPSLNHLDPNEKSKLLML